MRVFGLMLALLFGLVAPAFADTVIDPLHMCYAAGCGPFGGVTVATTPSLSGWGFSNSPASKNETGTLYIELLVPNNESFSGTLTGGPNPQTMPPTSFTISGPTSVGTFGTGQDLTTVTGHAASPPNPFSAYSGATAALDPTFTFYNVLEFTVGGLFTPGSASGQTSTLNNLFSLTSAPSGLIVTGFLDTGVTGGTGDGVISTAQSSSLLMGNTPSPVPLPGAFWLLGSGLVGLIGLSGRRKRPSCSILQAV